MAFPRFSFTRFPRPALMAAAVFPFVSPFFSPAVSAAGTALEMPRLPGSLSTAADKGIETIAARLWMFYTAPEFLGFLLALLVVCAVAGLAWRLRCVIAAEEPFSGLANWVVVRLLLGLFCFFVVAPDMPSVLSEWMRSASNIMGSMITRIAREAKDAELRETVGSSRVRLALRRVYDESMEWAMAAEAAFKGKIAGRSPYDVAYLEVEKTLTGIDGFPWYADASTYPRRPAVVNALATVENGVVVNAKPYEEYLDVFKLYDFSKPEEPGEDKDAWPVFRSGFVMRPYNSGAVLAYGRAMQAAADFDDSAAGGEEFRRILHEYTGTLQFLQSLYLRDVAAYVIDASAVYRDLKHAGDGDPEARTATLAVLEKQLDELRAGFEEVRARSVTEALYGSGWSGNVLQLLIPLALTVVNAYMALSIYSLPILISLWSALFFLPKELELSTSLKKGVLWMVVLFFLPIFSNVVVELAIGFVEAVRDMMQDEVLAPLGKGATGLAVGAMVPGSTMVKVGTGLAAYKASGWRNDFNLIVWVAWVVAFCFIIGMPLMLKSVISGANGFIDNLITKTQAGAMMAGGIMGLSLQQGASTAASSAGRASTAGKAAAGGLIGGPAGVAAAGGGSGSGSSAGGVFSTVISKLRSGISGLGDKIS
ncbi:hypothetical protein OH491_23910 [Termitidicoccus mucosus]|uniref:TraG N-terminal Proteobacteria domain-containing protein n=1 Tax=Termitidicoccus mucosus TaxID=1184151 RepID=A0A178INU1_9BACT|nr:hypothetical protein AW736_02585 [Opitutaceae bacterium TSB47]